jgi:hypothetical protein
LLQEVEQGKSIPETGNGYSKRQKRKEEGTARPQIPSSQPIVALKGTALEISSPPAKIGTLIYLTFANGVSQSTF